MSEIESLNSQSADGETQLVEQWDQIREIQIRLQWLRYQCLHRDSIHKAKRPVRWEALCEVNQSLVSQNEAELQFELTCCPNSVRAVARWCQTREWIRDAIELATSCQYLANWPQVQRAVLDALQMVTAARYSFEDPIRLLVDPVFSVDQRRRQPILTIRAALRYIDESCRMHLLEAEAGLERLLQLTVSAFPDSRGMCLSELKKVQDELGIECRISVRQFAEVQDLYREHPSGVTLKELRKTMGCSRDNAQALRELLRKVGIDPSEPRQKPGK